MKNKIEVTTRRPENMTKDIEQFISVHKWHIWDKDTYKEEPAHIENRIVFPYPVLPRRV